MTEPTPAARFCLRQLPFPAKLVVTGFLMAVGLGYTAAMVQLHMQDAKGGTPMPTPADVVAKFTGKRWHETAPPRPVSKLEKLIMGPVEGSPFNGNGSMAPAFFHKDGKGYATKTANPAAKATIDAEHEGERLALQLWINSPPKKRRDDYDADVFTPPADRIKAITPEYRRDPAKIDSGVKVKSILRDRCVRCHAKDAEVPQYPLEVYAELERYMQAAAVMEVPEGGGWVKVEEPMSMEKLTQSTHAHLLSFAMLFSLTGLVFAFTSYPRGVRVLVSPLALIAVTADVALWWLARLSDDYGPYFAMGVIGTGGIVGLALGAQIVFGLFNMYGPKGKGVLLALFALGLGTGGALYLKVIHPALQEKVKRLQAAKETTPPPATPPKNGGNSNGTTTPPAIPMAVDGKEQVVPPKTGVSRLERAFTGKYNKDGMPWADKVKPLAERVPEGGMILALFDKEGDFKKARMRMDPDLDKLIREREGDQAAFLEWVKAPPDARKKAYEANKFVLPERLANQPVSDDFIDKEKAFKVKDLFDFRCATCHGDGEEVPLHDYAAIEKLLAPEKGK